MPFLAKLVGLFLDLALSSGFLLHARASLGKKLLDDSRSDPRSKPNKPTIATSRTVGSQFASPHTSYPWQAVHFFGALMPPVRGVLSPSS